MMEQSAVVIIGAGPAGLVLALALAKHGTKSILLEKATQITDDPRGVYLAGDAVRILYDLGLGPSMNIIGHEVQSVNFHQTSWINPPFKVLDLTRDSLNQGVPSGILQVQPELERALHNLIDANELCTFRRGCDVQRLTELSDGYEIEYFDVGGSQHRLRTTWLIGADGKKGVVRKTFLEKIADIRQVESDYRYEGRWVAANLRITLPTLKTHPDFTPLKAGLSSEQVYDLYWPKGWHFCSPPGKPTASGRFGPNEARLWRHEFALKDEDDITDTESLFWEHITPMITRNGDTKNLQFGRPIEFPRDCVSILRCRPFSFQHKVVNKWYHRKAVLIGDAAHVFPPFGGQGIASGIRDAYQLAWRIALLQRLGERASVDIVERMLQAWTEERKSSIKGAADLTSINGILCNQSAYSWRVLALRAVEMIMWLKRGLQNPWDPGAEAEARGFQGVNGAFCFPGGFGGGRLPQIHVDTISGEQLLSDGLFGKDDSPLRILALVQSNESPANLESHTIAKLLKDAEIPDSVLSPASVVFIGSQPYPADSIGPYAFPNTRKCTPTPTDRILGPRARSRGYQSTVFSSRLGPSVAYAIVRADFFVFATAQNLAELGICLRELKKWV